MRRRGLWLASVMALASCQGRVQTEPEPDLDPDPEPCETAACLPVRPAGARVLGLEVNEPSTLQHAEQLEVAQAIGVGAIQLTFPWNVLEPTAGARDLGFLRFGLEFYRARGLRVLLSIPTIDTVNLWLPADLQGLALDHPSVRARFAELLGALLADDTAGVELTHLVVANEVDVYLGAAATEAWTAAKTFVDGAVDAAQAMRPEVQVGVSVTFSGLPDARLSSLVAATDVVFLTYYRHGVDFGASHVPQGFAADLPAMLTFAGDKPLVLKELGYPTAASLGGSEAGQIEFVTEVFRAWDAHLDRIPLVMFSRMFDDERSDCEATAEVYGLGGNEAFIDFLCTLGYRSVEGAPKPAWARLQEAAELRGFSLASPR